VQGRVTPTTRIHKNVLLTQNNTHTVYYMPIYYLVALNNHYIILYFYTMEYFI